MYRSFQHEIKNEKEKKGASLLKALYTCNFKCDFLLLIDVNEWTSYECSDEGTCTPNICNSSTRSHQKEKIALEIAAKIASVNGP
jgi:hypothetical protein